jgi:hypothetical protein
VIPYPALFSSHFSRLDYRHGGRDDSVRGADGLPRRVAFCHLRHSQAHHARRDCTEGLVSPVPGQQSPHQSTGYAFSCSRDIGSR